MKYKDKYGKLHNQFAGMVVGDLFGAPTLPWIKKQEENIEKNKEECKAEILCEPIVKKEETTKRISCHYDAERRAIVSVDQDGNERNTYVDISYLPPNDPLNDEDLLLNLKALSLTPDKDASFYERLSDVINNYLNRSYSNNLAVNENAVEWALKLINE